MTDPGDELQASHPLRDASVVVEDIEDNPGFFRVKLYAVPHFRVEGWTSICRWLARCPKQKHKAGRDENLSSTMERGGFTISSTVPAAD